MKLNEAIEAIEDVSSPDYFRSIDAAELTDWQDVAFTLYTANADLLEALENIRDTARTGLPISSMTQEQYDVHRLIAIAGRADYAIRKHKGE